MDRKHEDIASFMITAAGNYHVARLMQVAADYTIDDGLNDAAKSAVENYSEEFEQRKAEFWNAFKYPLEIFDLKKSEKPECQEYVLVFDELHLGWLMADLSSDENCFLPMTSGINRLDIERYHRWTRLPILEREG